MNIVIAGAEAVPFIKIGGLGDVLGALPAEYAKAGHKVSLFLPLYSVINLEDFSIVESKKTKKQFIKLGKKKISFNVFEYQSSSEGNFKTHFISNDFYFAREGIYSHPNNIAFEDEGERWLFFQKAIVKTIQLLDLKPDIIQVNDFHTALIPALIKFHYAGYYKNTKTLLTLHNLLFQGVYKKNVFDKSNINSAEFYSLSAFEYYGKINFVKTGIIYADAVNTVSPKYAEEILSLPELSYGLYGVLKENAHKFSGILNGADYQYWNPETDRFIAKKYTINSLEQKSLNRKALLKKTGIKASESTLLAGIVARMTDQKGFLLLLEAWRELSQMDIRLFILASGDKDLENAWDLKAEEYPEKIFIDKEFNEELAHQIQAGVDVFLMPSLFEPCGLSQLYSLKYGTPPIAHKTGGLANTIEDKGSEIDGFLFDTYDSESFVQAIKKAMSLFHSDSWKIIQLNGMKKEFSWALAAKNYLNVFYRLLES